jgi:hypothetical protein
MGVCLWSHRGRRDLHRRCAAGNSTLDRCSRAVPHSRPRCHCRRNGAVVSCKNGALSGICMLGSLTPGCSTRRLARPWRAPNYAHLAICRSCNCLRAGAPTRKQTSNYATTDTCKPVASSPQPVAGKATRPTRCSQPAKFAAETLNTLNTPVRSPMRASRASPVRIPSNVLPSGLLCEIHPRSRISENTMCDPTTTSSTS